MGEEFASRKYFYKKNEISSAVREIKEINTILGKTQKFGNSLVSPFTVERIG